MRRAICCCYLIACGDVKSASDAGPSTPVPTTAAITASAAEVRADGERVAVVEVEILDQFGDGYPGVPIAFGHNGGGNTVLGAARSTTDAEGIASTTLASVDFETVTATVEIDGAGVDLELPAVPSVAFVPYVYVGVGEKGNKGKLYAVKLLPTLSIVELGDIGYAVAALAMSSTGQLFATTSNASAEEERGKLLAIDPATGAGEVVASLIAGPATAYNAIAGLEFVGETLYGWVSNGEVSGGANNELVTIDPSSGAVTAIGDNPLSGSWEGNEIAIAPDGTLYASSYDGDNVLLTLDVATGLATKVANFVQGSTTPEAVRAAGFIGETLYGLEEDRAGGASLVTIDLTTAATTAVEVLPASSQGLTIRP